MESFPFVLPKRQAGAPSTPAKEYCLSRESAVELADKVNRYWANLGYDAEAHAVEVRLLGSHGNAENFTVVSNLHNGVPARRLGAESPRLGDKPAP